MKRLMYIFCAVILGLSLWCIGGLLMVLGFTFLPVVGVITALPVFFLGHALFAHILSEIRRNQMISEMEFVPMIPKNQNITTHAIRT